MNHTQHEMRDMHMVPRIYRCLFSAAYAEDPCVSKHAVVRADDGYDDDDVSQGQCIFYHSVFYCVRCNLQIDLLSGSLCAIYILI